MIMSQLLFITLIITVLGNANMTELEKICDSHRCQFTSCSSCILDPCCHFTSESKCIHQLQQEFKYNDDPLEQQPNPYQRISNPYQLVKYPKLNITEPVPLHNATNFYHQRFDRCGIPSFCSMDNFIIGNKGKMQFIGGNTTYVSSGQLCSWYFQGEMGPQFLMDIRVGKMNQLDTTIVKADISICLYIGYTENLPCTPLLISDSIQNNIDQYYRIPVDQFRITIQFKEDTQVDLAQFTINIISFEKINREQAEVLFTYLVIFMGVIIGFIILVLMLKYLLMNIFGGRFLHWIDPEPLIPRRSRLRIFDSKAYLQDMMSNQTILVVDSSSDSMKYDQSNCAYCLESLSIGVILEIYCGHIFHEKCLLMHLETVQEIIRCSICNMPINSKAAEYFRKSISQKPQLKESELTTIFK